jgi:hypothetical protein
VSKILQALGLTKADDMVVFQSRFRNYRVVLKQNRVGNDSEGRPINENVQVQFQNSLLCLPNSEENKELITLLRKKAGSDFHEVDIAKKAREENAVNEELAQLRKRVKELETGKVTKPTTGPVVKPGAKGTKES